MVAPSRRKDIEGHEYIERTYRDFTSKGTWIAFSVAVKETDLYIRADRDLTETALEATRLAREAIEGYIRKHPEFRSTLYPLPFDREAPAIVRDMLHAAEVTSVGHMAAVAGAIAESVGKSLRPFTRDVVVENGGDVVLAAEREMTVGVFAGGSPLSMRVGMRIRPQETPCGICTSSGKVGPSLSFGKADAVTVWAHSTALADAAATALANRVARSEDIEPALERARSMQGLRAALVILDDRVGLWGPVELVGLNA